MYLAPTTHHTCVLLDLLALLVLLTPLCLTTLPVLWRMCIRADRNRAVSSQEDR